VNSEELELSLRTEFENYLKGVLAGVRQDVSEFQKNFEAEFEKHKAQMDDALRNLTSRFESDTQFDQAFTQTVIEHLRLAKDEGAEIAAMAFGEAEKMRLESAPVAKYDQIRNAINDISAKTTQSSILKSLVQHAGQFTSRGAFFIVKNDHFVGWKAFGNEAAKDDEAMREIHFPMSADTLLAGSVRELGAREASHGSHSEDELFLDAMGFGQPERMYAIPLVARGRGVAVLYADHGTEGVELNIEALETMVRVAGLTVELLAASQAAKAQPAVEAAVEEPTAAAFAADHSVSESESAAAEEYQAEEKVDEAPEVHEEEPAEHFEEYTGEVAIEEPDAVEEPSEQIQPEEAASFEPEQEEEPGYFEPVAESEPVEAESPEPATDFAFGSSASYDSGDVEVVENEPEPEYAYSSDEAKGSRNGGSYEPAVETVPVVGVASAQPARSRLSDRNVDLPIEVADDERRFHNDARRFARLLVSEIKLYNEQKVNEGREAGDLYDRLREAIERSREMYDKRALPQVASKFDYFHYELVSNLADGEAERLGGNYPGGNV
jgi:hypothetical protein